jgi:hypothetical protein
MASDIFQNTTGGVWSLTTNWSAGLPDNNSQVTFADGTYTSTVDSTGTAWTIQSLNVNFSGVTLDVFSDLTAQTLEGTTGAIDVEGGATLTLVSMNSSSGTITVSDNGTLIVQNLNNNNGNITAATQGLVNLLGNGAGNFTVTGGILEIGGNYNGTGTITMQGGTLWLAGQLGSSSYSLGGDDKIFLDSPQFTTTNSFTGVNAGDLLGIKGVTITSANYSGTTLTLNIRRHLHLYQHHPGARRSAGRDLRDHHLRRQQLRLHPAGLLLPRHINPHTRWRGPGRESGDRGQGGDRVGRAEAGQVDRAAQLYRLAGGR